MNDTYVMTAHEMSGLMVAKSRELDEALSEYRSVTRGWVEADRTMRIARAMAYLMADGKTVAEREAQVELSTDAETFSATLLDAKRNGAKEALRARHSQLSALQSTATALREELKLVRTDNYS